MKTLYRRALLASLFLLPACGQQLVELSGPDGAPSSKTDAKAADAKGADGANADASDAHVGGNDAAGNDALGVDAGSIDALGIDVGSIDAMSIDAMSIDAVRLDVATPDVPALDVGSVDLGTSDGGTPDGGTPDVAVSDAAPDVRLPDAAGIDTGPDLTRPIVISTSPPNGTGGVQLAKVLTATFNEPMNPATINMTTFTLQQGTTPILGVVTYPPNGVIASFTPSSPLLPNTMYTVTITTGATDVAGNPLASNYTWSFTTSACSQATVDLLTAANFAVLAGSTVTNTGLTTVTGDLGVSPGSAVTGFGPGVLVGTQHAADATAAQAELDLTTAYNDAAGRVLCPVAVSGNLGGQTLTPGLYKSTDSLEISSGDLTLDAQGDPNAIFIFQMATTLMTTAGRQVILSGGAKSANVFWQVGTAATLGTTSSFQGTIMANQAITLTTGATLNGRALARIAAVALDTNAVVKPAP